MNWYSQLTRLILSFYREDPTQLRQLQPIQSCKLSRRWGVLRVDCQEQQTANAVLEAIAILREPVAELRLAHHINIMVKGALVGALPVNSKKPTRSKKEYR